MVDDQPKIMVQDQVAESVRSGPKWPDDVKGRVQAAIHRSPRPLANRGAADANEGDIEPKPVPTSTVSANVTRIRAELVDAGIAARRWLERLRWARLIMAAVAQVVIGLIAWRIRVWRGRPRLR